MIVPTQRLINFMTLIGLGISAIALSLDGGFVIGGYNVSIDQRIRSQH